MKRIFVILSFFISVTCFGSQSWANKIYLECKVIQGSTATNIMEVIISEDEICMGDVSGSPMCAKINDEIKSWEEKRYSYGKVSITDEKYNFRHYGNPNELYKDIVLDRYTGKAVVQYYDKKMNPDYLAIFQCKKNTKKKKF